MERNATDPRKNNFTLSYCTMAADAEQASACAGLQSRWRDSYERCGRRAKAPPQAEAWLKPAPWTGGPTLARKCEVIPAPRLTFGAPDVAARFLQAAFPLAAEV